MTVIVEWVRNLVVCVILIAVLMQLLPEQSVGKYMKVVTGILLMLVMISPLTRLLRAEPSLDRMFDRVWEEAAQSGQVREREERMREFARSADALRAEFAGELTGQEAAGAEEELRRVLGRHGLELTDWEMEYDLDYDSQTYGQATGLRLKARAGGEGDGVPLRAVREELAGLYGLEIGQVSLAVSLY